MYNGIKEKVCSVCNYSLREVISGHIHSPIDGKYSQSNPTCEKDGYKEYDCSCGEHIKETLPSLGHDIDVYYGYNDETHFSVEKCIRCDFYKESKAEKHSLDEKIISEATEFKDGLKIVYCYVCGYEKEVVIPSFSHIHDYEYSVVKVDATCQNEGYTRHSCICGEYYDSDIIEKQHSYYSYYNYNSDNHWLENYCNYCDDKYVDLMETHNFEITVIKEATEKQDGIFRYSCICGYSYDEIVPSGSCEHDYSPEFKWNNENGQVQLEVTFSCVKNPNHILEEGNYDYGFQLWAWIYEPTCISTGLATYRGEAIYNGKTYYDYADMELAADPSYHHYEETVIPPTCEDEGYTIYTCIDCGYSYKDNYAAMLGHAGQYSVCFDDLYHYDYFECDVCDYTDMYNPKKHNFTTQYGHDDINFEHWFVDICSDCGYSQIRDKIMHQFVEEVIVSPTEESEGLVRYTCYCEYSYEEVLPMLNHTHDYQPIFTWYPNFAPELDVSFVCSKDPSHVLDSSEYTYGFDVLEFINPTCMQEGYISYHGYATYNGVTYTEDASFVLPVDENSHNYDYETIVVDPTCEEQGYTIHRCICGLEYIDNYIDAKGHEYYGAFSYDEIQHWEFAICGHDANINYGPHEFNYEVIKEPTEYEEGEGLASCWCLYSYSYVIPPLGHTHVYSRIETIYPTCETQGYTRYTCECGDSYESDYVDAFGHNYEAVYSFFPNTDDLLDIGLVCQNDKSHQVNEDEMDSGYYVIERIEPTCTETGFERIMGYANYNGLHFEDEFSYYPNALGHNYHIYERVEPNCVSYGYERYYCDCGDYTETILDPIPATGHNLTEVNESNEEAHYTVLVCLNEGCNYREIVSYNYHNLCENIIKEPTCDESGLSYVYCTGCEYNSHVEVPPYGHDYQAYFTWFLAEDIPFEVYLQCNNDTSHIVSGYEMEIGWEILQQVDPTCTTEGYIDLYGYARYNGVLYEKYDTYVLTASGEHIYNNEYVCIDCGHYYYTEGLQFELSSFSSYSVVGYSGSDSNIIIPAFYEGLAVEEINSNAFINIDIIESIYIGSNVLFIHPQAINACCNLKYIYIPASVFKIAEGAITWCASLTNIEVSLDNHTYDSRENCNAVIETSSNTLLVGCIGTVIPNSVTAIYPQVFEHQDTLYEVYIPKNVQLIQQNAFIMSFGIQTVYILNKNIIIENNAFMDCSQICVVNFAGSETEWNNLVIGSGNEYLLNAQINYNYGHEHDYQAEVVEPTCETDGYTRYTCECGDYFDSDYIYATGHNKVDGYCSVCGILVPSEGLEFTLFNYEEYALTGLGTCTDNDIIIPEYYNGLPVTKINDNAFYECDSLTSIIISDYVTIIGYGAFFGCDSLKTVVMGNNVTEISHEAFKECRSLTSINIPDSVTYIGESSFQDCSSLTSIIIPEGVTNIGNNQYSGCSSLTNVSISSSVTEIGSFAFYNCSLLESIVFDKGSQLTVIWNGVFQECDSLISISIPEGVTCIENTAFWGCDSLVSITIPESVTKIYDDAFYGCNALTHIFYEGNEEKFNEIISGHESDIVNATVTYNYHHDNHNYFIEITTEPTSSKDGYVKTYCSCGEFVVSRILPSLGEKESAHTLDADDVFASKYGEGHELNYNYLNDTYIVNGVTITTHDVLIDTEIQAHNLFLMKDCVNGVNPSITIENVQVNSVQITFFDSSYSYAGYIDVYLDDVRLEENVLYREQVYGDVYKVVYEYYLSETATGTLIIENNDNGTKVIDTIKIYDN